MCRRRAACSMSPATVSGASRREMLDRLQSFRMREYVCIGKPEQIEDFRGRWMKRAEGFCRAIGLALSIEQASDRSSAAAAS